MKASNAGLRCETLDGIHHLREAAPQFGHSKEGIDFPLEGAVASSAGVDKPHERSGLQPGKTVLDLGSRAGPDAIIASWMAGPTGKVTGPELNPAKCRQAKAHAAFAAAAVECLRTDNLVLKSLLAALLG